MALAERIAVCIVILPIAPLFRSNREACINGIDHGAADVTLRIGFIEAAIGHRTPSGKVVGGPVRNVVDRPTCGVLTKQGALWSFEHLDALQVERHPFGHPCEREWNLV